MSFWENLGLSLLTRLDAETAHGLTIRALKSGLLRPDPKVDPACLAIKLPVSGLQLSNPVGLAAGFDKNAEVFEPMLQYGFGFVECGTVTPKPQAGNAKPRLFRLREDAAVINRMGFNNQGLGPFVRHLASGGLMPGDEFDIAKALEATEMGGSPGAIVGANIGANKASVEEGKGDADYVAGVKAVWPHCRYLTVNISSPNTPGLRGLQNKEALAALLSRVGQAAEEMATNSGARPIFLKIAPDMDDEAVEELVLTVLKAPMITGLIISNTSIARPDSLNSPLAAQQGGLSGQPLFEASTRVLKIAAKVAANRLDIIGVGGVRDAATAYAKIRAGAHAVQLYTALVYGGPQLVQDIKDGLADMSKADGYDHLSDAVGADL